MSLEFFQPSLDEGYDGQTQSFKFHERLEKLKEINKRKEATKPTLEDILKRRSASVSESHIAGAT